VQDEEVLAARAERGDGALAAVDAQADRVLVERERALEVGDGQVDRAEAGGVGEGGAGGRSVRRRERLSCRKSCSKVVAHASIAIVAQTTTVRR
jgi:hypothetical protein